MAYSSKANVPSKQYFLVELQQQEGNLVAGPGGYRDSRGRLKEQYKNPRPVTLAPMPNKSTTANAIPQHIDNNRHPYYKNQIANYFGQLIFHEIVDPALREGAMYLRNKALDKLFNLLDSNNNAQSTIVTKNRQIIDAEYKEINSEFSAKATRKSSSKADNIIDFKAKAM